MKIITLFLLLLTNFNKDYLVVHVESFESPILRKNIAFAIIIKEDSIRTYLPEIGHIWWKIDTEENVEKHKHYNILLSGRYKLSLNEHHSYLIINNKTVHQLIYLDGEPPLVFSIKMNRKQIKK
jgi:hypothetical protein